MSKSMNNFELFCGPYLMLWDTIYNYFDLFCKFKKPHNEVIKTLSLLVSGFGITFYDINKNGIVDIISNDDILIENLLCKKLCLTQQNITISVYCDTHNVIVNVNDHDYTNLIINDKTLEKNIYNDKLFLYINPELYKNHDEYKKINRLTKYRTMSNVIELASILHVKPVISWSQITHDMFESVLQLFLKKNNLMFKKIISDDIIFDKAILEKLTSAVLMFNKSMPKKRKR